ncbi:MAG: O-antigen ligase family protein [Vicinamibacterales bacterium]
MPANLPHLRVGLGVAAAIVLVVAALWLDVLPLGSYVIGLVGLLGLAALVIAVRWQVGAPVEGLSVLLVAALIAPLPIQGGIDACLVLALASSGVWLVRTGLAGQAPLDETRAVAATLFFMLVAAVSFVVGQYPWFPTAGAPMAAQLGGLALFLVSGSLFLAVGHLVRTEADLEKLTMIFVAVGGLTVTIGLLPWSVVPFIDRVNAVIRPDTLGSCFWTWLVAVSSAQAFFNRSLAPHRRLALLAVAVVTLGRGLLVAFSWVSGWLPPMVAFGLVCFLRFPRLSVALGLLSIAPGVVVAKPAIDALMQGESYSWMTRLEAMGVIWQLVRTNPLLGFGPANYYHYTLLFPILGWWVRFNSHNNYIDLVAQTGFLGLLAFFWFCTEVFLIAWRLRRRATSFFGRAYAVGALAGLAGSLVSGLLADWIVPFAYNIGLTGFRSSLLFWFLLGGLLTLRRLSAAPQPTASGLARRQDLGALALAGMRP